MATTVNRRSFLKGILAAGAAAAASTLPREARAAASGGPATARGMLIDLTLCDGCPKLGTPACVTACRLEHADAFPVPETPIKDYWPQKKHEDWSGKKKLTDTLTPYNWTFVQKIAVEHEGTTTTVNVPRHCMHCDDPSCAKACPIGALGKERNGAVRIDPDLCLGGAKCRSMCPWGIPQRQAGVGIYLNFDPAAGGGVLYKCDLCHDRITAGLEPACVEGCRQAHDGRGAITFGSRDEIRDLARRRASEIGGYTYGLKENGGGSVVYVSKVPFENLDRQLQAGKARFRMPVGVANPLHADTAAVRTLLLAPVVGIVAGAVSAGRAFVRAGTGSGKPAAPPPAAPAPEAGQAPAAAGVAPQPATATDEVAAPRPPIANVEPAPAPAATTEDQSNG